jgi:hypothetical protein
LPVNAAAADMCGCGSLFGLTEKAIRRKSSWPRSGRTFDGSAGGGTRTLKLFRAPAPKTGVFTNSTTPAFRKDRSEQDRRMSNPAEQERESRESGETKYEELAEQESAERREQAEQVEERLPERDDEGS